MAMRGSVSQAFMLFRHRIPCENFGSLSAINGTVFGFSSRKSSLFLHEQSGISVVKQGSLLQSFNFSSKGRSKSDPGTSDAFAKDKISEKEAALHTALSQIASSFGKETVMWLGRFSGHRCVPVISTGSINLDVALGIGGLPKGRMVEIYGQEASGKTTMALHVIAEAQKIGGYCVFVDAEHALDPSLAEAIGVNTQDLLLAQPDCGEQALSLVDTFIRSGSVDVVVVDSVAALVPQSELDGEIGDARIALQARLMSQALRKLTTPLSRSQTLLIFLNQVRSKLSTFGGFGGPTEVTSGGNALKFYASTRLNIRRTGLIKKGDQTIGSQVVVKVVKNKLAPPFKTAEFELEFGRGISREGEVLDLGCKHGFITKSGSHYGLNGEHFHGKDNAKKYLRENGDICDELIAKLKEKMLGFIDGQCNMGTLAQDAIYGQGDKIFSGNNSKEIESMGMTESLG